MKTLPEKGAECCDFCQEPRVIMAKVEIQLPGFRFVSRICGGCRKNGAVPDTVEGLFRRWSTEDSRRD